jgi:hypothetical protein
LSKKSKRKKQRIVDSLLPSKITFSFETVRMLKDALQLVEDFFLQNTKALPNLELAHDTLQGLQIKLNDMLQREEWDEETPLDHNEIYILYAAIHMYLVHLTISKESSRVTPCLLLCKQLSRLVEQMEGKPQRTGDLLDTSGE